jgi:cell division protein FtsB
LKKAKKTAKLFHSMRKIATWNDSSRPALKRVAGPMFFCFIMFYLGFHAVSGERGVFALFKETRNLEKLQTELADVKAKHEALEHKVHLLSDNSLDLDLLDEQVRRVLGMANKNEIVYFPDGKK